MSDLVIRSAQLSEAGALGMLIAESFSSLPISGWLAADKRERLAGMSAQFEMFVEHAIANGSVYVAGDQADPLGVAVWFSPGEIPDIPHYDERLAAACGANIARFVELDEAMHNVHPQSPEHAYLALMAVRESERSSGIGSALLDAHHQLLDAAKTPAYLEASGQPARRLYLRHGYVDSGPKYGPPGVEEFLPMWREPVSA